MKNLIFFTILFCIVACGYSQTNEERSEIKYYQPDWFSVVNYEVPEWFNNAKLGIFIHWGPYCVPAYCNEWYPRHMYDSTYTRKHENLYWNVFKYHKETYGDQKKFGYKDFIPMFKAEQFDAERWVDLFVKAGARYIVPVGEHHDGFAMYNSKHTRWNSVNMGPKRDIAGELALATRRRGLKFGLSSHFAEHWYYYHHSEEYDTGDPQYADLYGRAHAAGIPGDAEFQQWFYNRTKDMIDSYQPDLMWFDGALNAQEQMRTKLELLAYYYNKGIEWNKELVFNYKNNARHTWPDGCAVLDIERGKLKDIRKEPWQTDTALGLYNWGYTKRMVVKPARNVIHDLVDIVSKNGNLLLNVSPTKEGIIPEDQQKVLLELGHWLSVYGEAIYNTRPWKIFGEGPTKEDLDDAHMGERKNSKVQFTARDIRFTQKGRDIYVICMGEPKNEVLVKSLKKNSTYFDYTIKEIQLLGTKGKLDFELTEKGLLIKMPQVVQDAKYGCAFKIVGGELFYPILN